MLLCYLNKEKKKKNVRANEAPFMNKTIKNAIIKRSKTKEQIFKKPD